MLDDLALVYHVDGETDGMTAEQRLAYHQKHSRPVPEALHAWIEEQ